MNFRVLAAICTLIALLVTLFVANPSFQKGFTDRWKQQCIEKPERRSC